VRQPGAGPPRAPAPPRPPVWVLVLFWIGTAAVLLVAVVYGVAAAFPDVAAQSGDTGRVRVAATVVAICAGSLFVGQLLSTIGLTAGWPWARLLATLVCVAWALTCVGLPVALLALNSIWRAGRRPPAQAAPNWR
jgi:hypothetical protein